MTGNRSGEDDDVFAYLYRPEAGSRPAEQHTQQIPPVEPGPGGYDTRTQYAEQPYAGQQYAGYAAPALAEPRYGDGGFLGGQQLPGGHGGHGGGGGTGGSRIPVGPIAVILALIAIGVLGIWAVIRPSGDDSRPAAQTTPAATAPARPTPSDTPSAAAPFEPLSATGDKLQLAGGAVLATDHKGFTGAGFVAGFESVGASATWAVEVPEPGQYRLTVRYSNALGRDNQQIERKIGVTANGKSFGQIRMPVIGSWDRWGETWRTVRLKQGSNQIVIACGAGDSCYVNIDKVTLTKRS